jgi:hypothetical protein
MGKFMHFSIGNYSACGKVRTKHLATLKNWQINTRGSFVKGLGTRFQCGTAE